MHVREATLDDFKNIMRLYRQLHPQDPEIENNFAKETYKNILKTKGLHIFVLEMNEAVQATSYLNIIPNLTRNASPYAIIENVITEETLRGQGIGKALMKEVLAFAWKHNCYKATLQTGSQKNSTHEFYQSCGFVKGERFAFIARPNTP